LDPRTGYPGMLSQSATVLAPTAEAADVLATYLFLVGADEAMKKVVDIPFLIVNTDGVARYNEAFSKRVDVEMME
jgi:thiamine biosynthesis lipoprotein ApbE